MDRRFLRFIPAFVMLPAIMIGVFAMFINNVPTIIYMQNILCFVVLEVVYFVIYKCKFSFHKIEPFVYLIVSIFAIGLTFINLGVGGVHRWVSFGSFQLYVSSIVMPIIIINLWGLLQKDKVWSASIITIFVAVLLTLQPDASMVTAFSVVAILLWNKINNLSRVLLVVFFGGLTFISWMFLDSLEPITYVEGIFTLVINMEILATVLGVVSLAIMIIPFLFFSPSRNKIVSISFGVYYIIILLSNLVGNFPVPLMGYGISPIVGYFISIIWFSEEKVRL